MGVRSNVLAGDSIIAIPLTLLLMMMFATRKDVEWDRRRDTATFSNLHPQLRLTGFTRYNT